MKPASQRECFYWVIITYVLMFFGVQPGLPGWYFGLALFLNLYWTFRYLMEKRGWFNG